MSTSQLPRPLIGWPLFALPDEHGRLDWPDLEASVRQGIRVILSTRPGEQLMRPEFAPDSTACCTLPTASLPGARFVTG
ncbi:GPW/gp25 family protein [Candidatus Accumulibacter phosphatis]|uniref:GPW/gp25 family protein n=1 Tax=Candidatus Accumulibacter phosphatis TaxID=327160 RepID=UPI0020BF7103|nr:GPW/gp25 family protein [Candidatus Accumulibacter phosphatis]